MIIHPQINGSLATDLANNIVTGWDLNDCIIFCNDVVEKNLKALSFKEFTEQYENYYGISIVDEIIDWNDNNDGLTRDEPNWSDYVKVESHPVKHVGVKIIERCSHDDNDIKFWSVYLIDHDGLSTCILNLPGQIEAEVITRSIQDFYLN